jgi:antirestriction protein ArdC
MNKQDIYERITNMLMSKLEAGVVPWRRTWAVGIPRNYVSKHAYNGINFLSLLAEDHPSPYYITFLQAKEKSATINKGATGQLIVFGKYIT